jgi:hypothetical protein
LCFDPSRHAIRVALGLAQSSVWRYRHPRLPSSIRVHRSLVFSRGLQPFAQLRPAPPAGDVAHGDGDGLLLSDQHDQALAARDTGVEKDTGPDCAPSA